MPRTHELPADAVHYRWDTHNKPALAIASGDSVVMTTREVSDGQLTPASDSSIIQTLDWDRFYPLAGPIAVEGARPGDTLAIEIVDLAPGDWGWTAIIPGKGLLPGDFPEPYPRISDLTRCDTTAFGDAVTIPIAPFLGDGRVSGRRPRAGGDAARHVRRQPRHASARAARRSICQWRSRSHSSPAATRMPHRATGRCASPELRPPWTR